MTKEESEMWQWIFLGVLWLGALIPMAIHTINERRNARRESESQESSAN